MKNKLLLCALSALLAVAAASGCGSPVATEQNQTAEFAKVTDGAGRTVIIDKKPERIVVTSASFLEPLHAVGGTVVGRPTSKTPTPDYAKDAAEIGAVYQIDTEKLFACAPDLVIVNKGMNEKLLQQNNVPALVVPLKSYDDVKEELKILAAVTGEGEKADKLIADMDDRIKAVADKIPKEERRVAVLHSTAQGLSVQLEGSIAGTVAKMLGLNNVADGMTPMEKNPDAAPYSLETLTEQNPEIIFVTSMGKLEEIKASMDATMAENPAWQSVEAVRQGKVFYLPQDLFLLSPGLHYPEAVEMMARLVYPEAF